MGFGIMSDEGNFKAETPPLAFLLSGGWEDILTGEMLLKTERKMGLKLTKAHVIS